MGNYTVKEGDSISSIAYKLGLFWETVWNHPENLELKNKRKDPEVLYPGDNVFIPEKRKHEEGCATDQTHRFIKRGVPDKLCLQLLVNDKPRANERYVLNIDGNLKEGVLNEDGYIDELIMPDAEYVKLIVGEDAEEIILKLGAIEPIDEIAGLQCRLNNLGYFSGPVDNVLGEKTRNAIKKFQQKEKLEVSGEPDQATRNKLVSVHGV
jgi:N-acetylmuramoyl-L-alanine amidase